MRAYQREAGETGCGVFRRGQGEGRFDSSERVGQPLLRHRAGGEAKLWSSSSVGVGLEMVMKESTEAREKAVETNSAVRGGRVTRHCPGSTGTGIVSPYAVAPAMHPSLTAGRSCGSFFLPTWYVFFLFCFFFLCVLVCFILVCRNVFRASLGFLLLVLPVFLGVCFPLFSVYFLFSFFRACTDVFIRVLFQLHVMT